MQVMHKNDKRIFDKYFVVSFSVKFKEYERNHFSQIFLNVLRQSEALNGKSTQTEQKTQEQMFN